MTTKNNPLPRNNPTFREFITNFADVLEAAQRAAYLKSFGGYSAPHLTELQDNACKVSVHYGKCFVRVDVGSSGRYMVDAGGCIYGIKGYGVVHRGHRYGCLDTVKFYDWSGYSATLKPVGFTAAGEKFAADAAQEVIASAKQAGGTFPHRASATLDETAPKPYDYDALQAAPIRVVTRIAATYRAITLNAVPGTSNLELQTRMTSFLELLTTKDREVIVNFLRKTFSE